MVRTLPGVRCCNLGEILAAGATEEKHMRNLETVLQTLGAKGVRVRREKREFMKPKFLGHVIDFTNI